MDAIKDPKQMEDELSKDKLLRRDVEGIISSITPNLPYISLLSGGVTVGKHISKHMCNKVSDKAAKGPQPESTEGN